MIINEERLYIFLTHPKPHFATTNKDNFCILQ